MRPHRPFRHLLLLAVLALLAACSGAEDTEPTATDTAPEAVPTTTATEPLTTSTETEPLPTDTEEAATGTEPAIAGTGTEAPTAGTGTEPTAPDTESGAAGEFPDIMGMAAQRPEFRQLTETLEAAGLQDVLSDVGPITVFAPTDEAFSSLDQSTLTDVLADPSQLDELLQGHVVDGELLASDLTDDTTLDTLAGTSLTVSVDGDTIRIGDATVTSGPFRTTNGVLYGIDSVLLPAG